MSSADEIGEKGSSSGNLGENVGEIVTGSVAGLMSSDEFQITPADQPHVQLAPFQLDRYNWKAWRIAVSTALSVKAKDGFVDGLIAPRARTDPQYRQWKRVDNLVLTWLRNSISPDIAGLFLHITTSRELWLELEDRYGRVCGPRALMVRRKIYSLVQGSKSITDYYIELKSLWNDYRALKPFPNCDAALLQVSDAIPYGAK